MPTYEYACKSCGEHLEVAQSFKDDPLTECPACGGPLRKVFGSIGIAFKGSGFYKNDSRSGSSSHKPAKAAESTGTGGSTGDSGGGTPESKPAAASTKTESTPSSGSGSSSSGTAAAAS